MNTTTTDTHDSPAAEAPAMSLDRLRADLTAHARAGHRVAIESTDRDGAPLVVVGRVGALSGRCVVIERQGSTWSTIPLARVTRVSRVGAPR